MLGMLQNHKAKPKVDTIVNQQRTVNANKVSWCVGVVITVLLISECGIGLTSAAFAAGSSSVENPEKPGRIEDTGNFLKIYDSNRDKYPTFKSFFPEFVKFISDYIARAK